MLSPAAFLPTWRKIMEGLAAEPDGTRTTVDAGYLNFLISEFARLLPFDAAHYQAAGPALPPGTDPHEHFVQEGFRAGRAPHPVLFDPAYYIRRNSDLAHLFAKDGEAGLRAHFERNGIYEGRVAHAAAEQQAERWWRAAAHRTPGFAHRTLPHAVVLAYAPPLLAGEPYGFRGGPVLTDTPADRLLRHRRGGRAVDSFPTHDGPIARLAGEYVYGGPSADHFGHVMAEMVHRVLTARFHFPCRRLLFVGERTGAPPAGFAALPRVLQNPLRFLGVAEEDVTLIQDDRVVETLHVAQQGSELTAGPLPAYLPLLSAHTMPRLGAQPRHGRVYVSRSRLQPAGMILGESYFEALLQADGWRILHPQDHGFEQQMRAYAEAEVLLFAEGSAVHGTELFGRDLGHCLLLPRRTTDTWWLTAALRSRAGRFTMLPPSVPLGTILLHRITGAPLGNFGVSKLAFSDVVQALRAANLASLAQANVAEYRTAALADLARYIAWWQDGRAGANNVRLVPPPDIASFTALARSAIESL